MGFRRGILVTIFMAIEPGHNLIAALEALLFAHGDPLEMKKIASVLGAEISAVAEGVGALHDRLAHEERGLMLVRQDSRVQLVTKPTFAPLVEHLIKDEFEEHLTPAALETLSLIAYLGPISRARIDHVRGVNSSYSVRNLMMRGLIEKATDPQAGHAPAYRISFDLLKHLGIASVEDLPDYHTFKEVTDGSEIV